MGKAMGFGFILCLGILFLQFTTVIDCAGLERDPPPPTQPQINDYKWDMVIAHGRNLTFITHTGETNTTIEVKVPLPTNAVRTWTSDQYILIPHSDTMEKVSPEVWEKQTLHLLAFDPVNEPHLIFFTQTARSVYNVAMYNTITDKTTLLFQCVSCLITGLVYNKKTLLWTESRAQTIMTLANPNDEPWALIEPTTFVKSNKKINGLVVDRETGIIYWANWENPTSSFEFHDGQSVQAFNVDKVYLPQSLAIHNSTLYWVNRPVGAECSFESIHLKTLDRRLIYSGRYHSPFTVASMCERSIIWSDVVTRTVMIEAAGMGRDGRDSVIYYKTYARTNTSPMGFLVRNHTTFDQKLCTGMGFWKNSTEENTPAIHENSSQPFNFNISAEKRSMGPNVLVCDALETDYCFNGGTCISIEGNLYCLCQARFAGPKCETEFPPSSLQSVVPADENSEFVDWHTLLIISTLLSILVFIFLVLSVYLGTKLYRLRDLKPKIRRRVILARSAESEYPTPLCEMIDVENCCNMNICETPCVDFGPTSATYTAAKPGNFPEFVGHDDKQGLLLDC